MKSLERLLGLRINLADFHHRAATDTKLVPLVKRFRGMKPPRFPTVEGNECVSDEISRDDDSPGLSAPPDVGRFLQNMGCRWRIEPAIGEPAPELKTIPGDNEPILTWLHPPGAKPKFATGEEARKALGRRK